MSGLAIRSAAEADAGAIAAIYAHHVLGGLGTFEEAPPPPREMAGRIRDVLARGLPYLVAEDGASLVGYAYAAPFRPRLAYRYSVEDSVYVAPDAIGRGVGRALLGALIAECEAMDLRQLVAVIGDSGNAASIGLHRALGFEMIGTNPALGFKHGRWVDIVTMQRALGGGDGAVPYGDGWAERQT